MQLFIFVPGGTLNLPALQSERLSQSYPHNESGAAHAPVVRLTLRVDEAARALGVSRTTLYVLMRSGAVPVVRIGRAVRISTIALDRFVSEQSVPRSPASAA